MTWEAAVRLRPVPGGFQGEDEESRLRVCLEAVHHVFSLPEGAAAVEEHRTFSQPALEEICQLVAHALELGEDQGLFTAGLDAFCEIEEALSFAGEGGVPVVLFGEEGGMVADFLQREDHLQDEALALEEGGFVSVLLLADDAEALFYGLVIQGGLRGGKECVLVLLELVRKVADDGLVCLETAQEHGRGDAFEAFGCFSVLLVLDGIRIAHLEGLRTAEVAFVGKFHDGPEFFEAVLDGGAEVAMRMGAFMPRTARLWAVSGFLMFCASSMMKTSHFFFLRSSWSLRRSP